VHLGIESGDCLLGPHLGHIFLMLVENIERIATIEFCKKLGYLLKSMGNLGMSMS
jgi:hypothetical protein